jgi:hypothetical protein
MEKRYTEKESVTFISSRSLLGRGDPRGTLGHHSNSLRRAKACFSCRLGILNILLWEEGGWRGWASGKMVGKEDGGGAGH